jgi:hypothetical protein
MLEEAQARLEDLLVDGTLDREAYARQRDRLAAKLVALDARTTEEAKAETAERRRAAWDEYASRLDLSDRGTFEWWRSLVEEVVVSVEVDAEGRSNVVFR